ncbi:MAG: methyl-accepting chemotaxis protein [Alphaproteobacteria bacterium]|nr:methyl-accepting chemotaxis protein [Alphaproteobacteria bacterium]
MSSRLHKTVFAAILSASVVPLATMACRQPDAETLALTGGLLVLTAGGAWLGACRLGHQLEVEALAKAQDAMEDGKEHAKATTKHFGGTLTGHASKMLALTDDHQHKATITTSAAAKALESAAIIAAAIEEMNSSIIEIGRQADDATNIASDAAQKATAADSDASSLSEKSDQILSIVELIRDIAGKTNLLALNATIEAARAGEQGRGFAVVASEVKNLAKQTAEATTKIEAQINDMRAASHTMKSQMKSIQETIEKIDAITKTIKTALHEETAATHEIARSAGETSTATNAVTDGISHMLITTEEIRRAAEGLGQEISATCERVQKELG